MNAPRTHHAPQTHNVHRTYHAPLLVGLILLLGGCSPHVVDDILQETNRHRYRVDRDVRQFVVHIDRGVRLNQRQARDIERMLADRTFRILDRTHARDVNFVYPFPRRSNRNMNRAHRQFWYEADRWIDRRLSRSQARRYAEMTGRARRGAHPQFGWYGSRNGGDRYEDDRYDDDYDDHREDRYRPDVERRRDDDVRDDGYRPRDERRSSDTARGVERETDRDEVKREINSVNSVRGARGATEGRRIEGREN